MAKTPQAAPAAAPALAPRATVTVTDQQAVIAQQLILLSNQAALIRHYEDQLTISPPGPTPPVPPPPAGTNLQALIDSQTAAIRTQASYSRYLTDMMTGLGITPTSASIQ